jgi:hypothetical protein
MRTGRKRSDRRNALPGVLLQLERCEKYERSIRSEGFSDSVYFYHKILQNVRDCDREAPHQHCRRTHGALHTFNKMYIHLLIRKKRHFCKIGYITHLVEPFQKKTRLSVTRQQGFAFVPTTVDCCQQNGVTVFSVSV